jgi:hypothetical protein
MARTVSWRRMAADAVHPIGTTHMALGSAGPTVECARCGAALTFAPTAARPCSLCDSAVPITASTQPRIRDAGD